ncbi:MAG: T9SS type A sorting domain-containing protein [Cyclobacteriaceae bacterium]|nr:T9SS type A sorting domain-containing protein [Cyclobacteriaceae bacterium]
MRLLFLLLLPFPLCAQFTYRISQDIPVEVNGTDLRNPWAGGLNSPQVSMMDLDNDGSEDLVVFDKMTAQVRTFLWSSTEYRYAPQYEPLFPEGLNTFVLLRDFNCDGKKDLFTFGQIGILVFQQITEAGKPFAWKKLRFFNSFTGLYSEVLLTKGFTTKINLLPGTNDLPDFTDMDGDGDLDVLNMRFVSPSTAEYHRNLSMERYGTCDSLDLERQTSNWGGFIECSCGKVAFEGQTCADIGGRTNHTGGKAMLSLDVDGDLDKDLLFTEESCLTIYRMENLGTTETPVMNNLAPFPLGDAVSMPNYPAPYLEDVDHDGQKDLLIGLNLNTRDNIYNDLGSSLWRYKNTGTNSAPAFVLEQNNFLQDEMIEVGDLSAPALADIDQDGDLDLFVGTFINPHDFRGALTYYQNIGTPKAPRFRWVTDNFAGLTFTSLYNIRPQFIDIDKNGYQDMAFTAAAGGITRLWYILSVKGSINFDGQNLLYFNIPIGANENATLADIDLDGRLDVLVGTSTGALYYYRNTGSGSAYSFSLSSDSYLGLASGTSRQNLAAALGDLDDDGREDLIVGDQLGLLSIFSDFRSTGPSPLPETNLLLVFEEFSQQYLVRNLGGNTRPAIGNLLGVNRPSLVVGNQQGGLHLLHADNTVPLSNEPRVTISPNPVAAGDPLIIRSDRSVTMEIFTVLGTRLGQSQVIPGGQLVNFPIQGIASGLYIARFTAGGMTTTVRFIIQ